MVDRYDFCRRCRKPNRVGRGDGLCWKCRPRRKVGCPDCGRAVRSASAALCASCRRAADRAPWLEDAVELRLGGWTLEAIGDRFGVTKERVRAALEPFGLDAMLGIDVRHHQREMTGRPH